VKLYVNRASMGFSDADSVPCAEQFTLTPAQLEGEPLTLKPVKFGNVDLLTILVDSNQVGVGGTGAGCRRLHRHVQDHMLLSSQPCQQQAAAERGTS
jgi:hypothetical protein